MTIVEFSEILQSYTPTGWSFWANHLRSAYNYERDIQNTMQLVLPRAWPSRWRETCEHTATVELWFLKLVELKKETEGTQQHDPYSSLEERHLLHQLADEVIEQINTNDKIQVLNVKPYNFFDSPEGRNVNRQILLQCEIELRVYDIETFDYLLDIRL
jgi:hypothetical protein